MRFLKCFAAALAMALATAHDTAAFVIVDDFETGPANLTATNFAVDTTLPNAGGAHAVSSNRRFRLLPSAGAGGSLTATVTPWSLPDDVLTVRSTSGFGSVSIEWNWVTPRDLTEGGAVDSLQFLFAQLPATGGKIDVLIGDANEFTPIEATVAEPGIFKIRIADWPLVDVTAATRIALKLSFLYGEDDATYKLADIRTIGAGAATPRFVGEWTLLSSSPLPSAPCVFRSELPSGNPLYRTEVGFFDIQTGTWPPALDGTWGDRAHFDGEMCAIPLSTEPGGAASFDWVGVYEFFVDLTPAGAPSVEIAFPPDPIRGVRSVGVPLMIATRDAVGAPIGASNAMLFFDVAGSQPVVFNDAYVVPVVARGAAITGLRVVIDVALEEFVEEAEPVFEISWRSDYTAANPTGVESVTPAAASRASLVAAPSLTRGSTEIRAALPFAPGDVVRVHDIAGRLVRELRPGASAASVVWDGRDEGGRNAPAGMYFARHIGRASAGAARIVVVR